MRELLQELEQALTDLLQMGLATAGPDMADRMKALSDKCENTGLHTGKKLLAALSEALSQRNHSMEKSDHRAAEAVFRAQHYIILCQTRLTEEEIRDRWQEGGQA